MRLGLACEEARMLEQMRAAWQPPEPEPPPLIDKVYPTDSFKGPGVLLGAEKSLTNKQRHGLYL